MERLSLSLTPYPLFSRKPFSDSHPNQLEDKNVLSLAKKHNKTPAQILLRYVMDRGIAVIPKSVNAKRVKENFDVSFFRSKKRFSSQVMFYKVMHFDTGCNFLGHHFARKWDLGLQKLFCNYWLPAFRLLLDKGRDCSAGEFWSSLRDLHS